MPARAAPDAERAGLRAAGDPAGRGLDRAQGHRPYRRQYRGRAAAPNIPRPTDSRRADVTYDDLGGMRRRPSTSCARWSSCRLRYPEIFQRLGVDPPKGVLLHGPPGTGKTRLARAVANESDANFFHIAGPEIMGSAYGESEKRLREIFEQAAQSAPSIIFIDEIDSIAPKRGQVTGEAEKRLVAQLLTLLDGLEPRQNLGRDRRHQPARGDRRGAAPPRPLRPRDRHRRARRARAAARSSASTPAACRSPTTSTSPSSRAGPTASSAPTLPL